MQGILMRPDMIQATVDGRKTNTRRLMNPQPSDGVRLINACGIWSWELDGEFIGESKPRYQADETVYIKESHYRYGHWRQDGFTKTGRQKWAFKADTNTVRYLEDTPLKVQRGRKYPGWYKRPALFMPAWAARHFILIEAVRPETLQEITEEDAKAEGFSIILGNMDRPSARWYFKNGWNSINPAYPWDSNDWVWVYQFRLDR